MNNLNQRYFKTRETHKKNFKKSGWILWIGLLLIFGYYAYKQIKDQLTDSGVIVTLNDNESCMIESEFQLGEIHYLDTPQQIMEKIGKPYSIEEDSFTNANTWIYKDLEIRIMNNHINYISCKDSTISTPNGLRVGLMKCEVDRILFGKKAGVYKIVPGTKEIQIVNCATEFYMIIKFDSNKIAELCMGLDVP